MKRRLRLKRILILLARILAVVALAMLIAHPTVPSKRTAVELGSAPRSLVIVIDNSASMTAEIEGGEPWDRAVGIATSIAKSIGTSQEIAVLATNAEDGSTMPAFSAKPEDVIKFIEEIEPSYAYRTMGESLTRAQALLETAHHELKQILLITDLQRAPWEDTGSGSIDSGLVLIDVGAEKSQPVNAAIANVELQPAAGEALYSALIELEGFATEPIKGKEIVVTINGEARARGFVDLAPGSRIEKKLSFNAQGRGILRGTVHLSPDVLAIDNDRYFTARAGGRIKTLIVDGDPSAERYASETYYLMNALNPKLDARSRIDPLLITVTGLDDVALENIDLVIMANVGEFDMAAYTKLKNYVDAGGAVLIALGDNIDKNNFLKNYHDLAPADLYVLNELAEPTSLDPISAKHPAVSMFVTAEGGDISLSAFTKYFMLDTTGVAGDSVKTVIKYKDGSPALIEKSLGRGKVALWTSTLDRDWNNLCIYPTYLPFLQQLILYLTGGMADPLRSEFLLEESAELNCNAPSDTAFIITPEGNTKKKELAADGQLRKGAYTFNDGPGFYEMYCNQGNGFRKKSDSVPDKLFAANVDTRESNLQRWDKKTLEAKLGTAGYKEPKVAKNLSELADKEGFKAGRRDAAKLALALIVMMLFMEGVLTRKG